jgi:hypothetical protein
MTKKEINWESDLEHVVKYQLTTDFVTDKQILTKLFSKLLSQEREKIVEEIKKGLLNCPKTDWGDTDEETPDSWEEGYEQCLQDTLDFVNNLLQKQ